MDSLRLCLLCIVEMLLEKGINKLVLSFPRSIDLLPSKAASPLGWLIMPPIIVGEGKQVGSLFYGAETANLSPLDKHGDTREGQKTSFPSCTNPPESINEGKMNTQPRPKEGFTWNKTDSESQQTSKLPRIKNFLKEGIL